MSVDGGRGGRHHEPANITTAGSNRRESLRAQTCFKECNLLVIEKRDGNEITDRWTGARYGPRKDFAPYAAQAGMRMGFMGAEAAIWASAATRAAIRPVRTGTSARIANRRSMTALGAVNESEILVCSYCCLLSLRNVPSTRRERSSETY